ncbi:hypothetical protein [Rufibacter roseus]|uniref:Lipoprotein n=1 Tax=Rufibacter roseus TaxID=1567108 RepID=A0ABW2DMP3_9BACT|nr:hypothetical protein [Rufibacter roseus]
MKAFLIFIFIIFLYACSDNSDQKVNGNIKEPSTESDERKDEPEIAKGLITFNSVDKAFVGMDIKDLLETYKNYQLLDTPAYYFEIDSEERELVIAKDNKPLMFVWSKDDEVVELCAISPSLRTKSNLRPGMTIKEIKEIYSDIKMSQDIVTGNTESIYIPQEKVALCFFTEQKTIGIYKDSDETGPMTSEFKSDTFRVNYIQTRK